MGRRGPKRCTEAPPADLRERGATRPWRPLQVWRGLRRRPDKSQAGQIWPHALGPHPAARFAPRSGAAAGQHPTRSDLDVWMYRNVTRPDQWARWLYVWAPDRAGIATRLAAVGHQGREPCTSAMGRGTTGGDRPNHGSSRRGPGWRGAGGRPGWGGGPGWVARPGGCGGGAAGPMAWRPKRVASRPVRPGRLSAISLPTNSWTS
jgi:hypothetical protein